MAEIVFDEANHEYWVDGELKPNVTRIISYLGRDYTNVDPFYSQRGQAVHLAIQYLNQGILDESSLDDEVKGYVDAYKAFIKEKSFKPLYSELRMYSDIHGFCGTADVIGEMDGLTTLIDYKTGSQIPPIPTILQLGALSLLWDEGNRTNTIQKRGWLQLKQDGSYDWKDKTEYSPRLFLRWYTLWKDLISKHTRPKKNLPSKVSNKSTENT